MSNILFVYERDMATVTTMRMNFTRLFQNEKMQCIFKTNQSVREEDINMVDVLVLIRADNTLSQRIAEQARRRGCFIIFFMDDDLFCLPKTMPAMPWRIRALKRNLLMSDMILSPSPYICEKYQEKTRKRRGVLVDTAVSAEEINTAPVKSENFDEPIKMVYAAGNNHEVLFERYIEPILPKLSDKYGKNISLTFVGVHPQIDEKQLSFNISYHSSMPLLEYRKFMKRNNFDIGFSPLEDDSFSSCKYFNKYIEYTLVGITGIFSDCKPYTYIVKDGVNGFLTSNDMESWFETICKVIDENNLRRECYKNALEQLKTEFNDTAIKDKLIHNIPELVQEKRSKKKVGSLKFAKIEYKFLRAADTMYLLMFYLRRMGIRGVGEKIRVHIKESKNYS